MVKLAQDTFENDFIMDIPRGDEVALNELFSVDGYGKRIELLADVAAGTTLTINVSKMAPFKARVDSTKRGGAQTILSELLQYNDLTIKQKALEDIRRLERLSVSIEK